MIIFPLIAAAVSAVFGVLLILQFSRKKGLHQLTWGISLAMYALASLVVAYGVGQGWDPSAYKVFWLFGAMLNVPYLAMGSIALLGNRVVTAVAVLAVAALTLFGFGVVATAKANRAAFVQQENVRGDCPAIDPSVPQRDRFNIPRGKCVWPAGSMVGKLGSLYSIPAYVIVVGIALATSRPRHGLRPPANRARANWLIAAGATIVAVGGTAIARLGRGAPFSIALALGVIVMFIGFVTASRPPSPDEKA